MKELEDFVRQYLIDNNIPLESPRAKKNVVDLIVYGVRKSGWSTSTTYRFSNKYFFNKPKNKQLLTYIYLITGIKYCRSCNTLLSLKDDFYTDGRKQDGAQTECKTCSSNRNKRCRLDRRDKDVLLFKRKENCRSTKYKVAKLNRLPVWADLGEIATIYENCPVGYQIDHIIPLQGAKVSGLHVAENLQYLTPSENSSKNNKYEIQ